MPGWEKLGVISENKVFPKLKLSTNVNKKNKSHIIIFSDQNYFQKDSADSYHCIGQLSIFGQKPT